MCKHILYRRIINRIKGLKYLDELFHFPKESNFQKINTRDSLVYCLLENQPKKAKQLHRYLKNSGNKNITYQAVHKSLSELVDKKVLHYKQFNYFLNPSWIDLLDDIHKKFKLKNRTKNIDSFFKKTQTHNYDYSFNYQNKISRIYFKIFKNIIALNKNSLNKKNGIIIIQRRPYFMFDLNDKNIVEKLKKVNCRYYSRFNNDLDLNSVYKLNSIFSKVHTIDFELNCDLFIVGDYIVQLIFPESTLTLWKNLTNISEKRTDNQNNDYSNYEIIANLITKCTIKIERNSCLVNLIESLL